SPSSPSPLVRRWFATRPIGCSEGAGSVKRHIVCTHPLNLRRDSAAMPNRLAHETSPYLLQHQHNPVDWYPWGEEAIARSRAEAKPIFLSIGYSACHWCHVMERESFES